MIDSSKDSVPPASETPQISRGLADVFSFRAQASLFALLIAFLGFVGWKSWAPSPRHDDATVIAPRGTIDLNRADRTELMLLDGIGPELADRIITYRDLHGPFEGLADLRKVNGIGPMAIERIRPRITLSWPAEARRKSSPPAAVFTVSPAALLAKVESLKTIDPNSASLQELETLPGIGPKIAQRIIDQRSQKAFTQVSDLRRVPGIGVKTLEKITPHLKLGSETAARVQ